MGTLGAQIGHKWPIWAAPRPGMVPVRGAEFDVTLWFGLERKTNKNSKKNFLFARKIMPLESAHKSGSKGIKCGVFKKFLVIF